MTKKTTVIRARITPEEKAIYQEFAESLGVKLSELILLALREYHHDKN